MKHNKFSPWCRRLNAGSLKAAPWGTFLEDPLYNSKKCKFINWNSAHSRHPILHSPFFPSSIVYFRLGIVISALEIVERGFSIVYIAAIAQRVPFGQQCGGAGSARCGQDIAPGIVDIADNLVARLIQDPKYNDNWDDMARSEPWFPKTSTYQASGTPGNSLAPENGGPI